MGACATAKNKSKQTHPILQKQKEPTCQQKSIKNIKKENCIHGHFNQHIQQGNNLKNCSTNNIGRYSANLGIGTGEVSKPGMRKRGSIYVEISNQLLYGDEELELPEITIQSRESKEEREKEGELEGQVFRDGGVGGEGVGGYGLSIDLGFCRIANHQKQMNNNNNKNTTLKIDTTDPRNPPYPTQTTKHNKQDKQNRATPVTVQNKTQNKA